MPWSLVAASALKHTIPRDFNRVSKEEVFSLMGGDVSEGQRDKIKREMHIPPALFIILHLYFYIVDRVIF